jgi:hypothetical protein
MLHEGKYPVPVEAGGICASDAAGEVVALGSEVIKFKIGDRVAPTIDLEALTSDDRDIDSTVLGGNGPGVLTEYTVFEEQYLVKLPDHLSWEEVSDPVVHCSMGFLKFIVGFYDHGRRNHGLGCAEPSARVDKGCYCSIARSARNRLLHRLNC